MDKEYISEVHDNYRRPEFDLTGEALFNFLDSDEQEQWKLKLYEKAVENENEQVKRSSYKELFCSPENKWWQEIMTIVTPAGKACYKEKPSQLITPQDFIRAKVEEKLKEVI